MSTKAHHQFTATGFILIYLAGMGSLFVMSTPYFESAGLDLLAYVLLPVAGSGAVLIAYARIAGIDGSDPG